MKVVGAKLDDSDYERFETFCIDEGISKSEILRGLIKQYCDVCEDDLQSDSDDKKPTITIIDEN
ncbi:MAG: CopG family transcriptional regulator [Nitrosopumilus sp.]|nr:CopG family transcriptional regulator [Nitrosopumilus sp.]